MEETTSLLDDDRKRLAISSTKLIKYFAEKGQVDDKNIKFLHFLRQVLKLVAEINDDLRQFSAIISECRHLQNFKLSMKEITEEDLVIIEIYIIVAGSGLLPRLPVTPLVKIIMDD